VGRVHNSAGFRIFNSQNNLNMNSENQQQVCNEGYSEAVELGFSIITNSGLVSENYEGQKAINTALQYNIDLMTRLLLQD
jgi:hypothetical protein